jgi:hypothetical protein
MSEHPPKRAVYTALLGAYERLQEQPVATSSAVPFICLTDDPALTSETWDVRLVDPAFERDSSRSSRFAKIVGDPLLAEYDETLWIDNRIVLAEDPTVILDELLADADLGVIKHSHRDSVVAEFDEVTRAGLDEPTRIYEQLIHYAETKPHILDQQPYWGAFIARRRTPEIQAAMQTWMNHVLRYSRRDQLSMRYALDGVPRVLAVDLDNHGSHWHTWVDDPNVIVRDQSKRIDAFRTAIRAPIAEVAVLNAEIVSLRAALEAEKQRSASALEAEKERSASALARATHLRARVDRLVKKVDRLTGKVAAERTRSARLRGQLAQRPGHRVRAAVRRVLPRPR